MICLLVVFTMTGCCIMLLFVPVENLATSLKIYFCASMNVLLVW
jgi:hypothetical protein